MRKLLFVFLPAVFFVASTSAQVLGVAQPLSDFNATTIQTGAFQNVGALPLPDKSHDWTHLWALRHSEAYNNHQLQIASSYTNNDRLFFRKIQRDLSPATEQWTEVATRSGNTFNGLQAITGKVFSQAITEKVPALRLQNQYVVPGRYFKPSVADFVLSRWEEGGDHRPETQLDIRLSGNAGETYDGYFPNVDVMSLRSNGNIGIGTTHPVTKLDVRGIISTPEIAFRNGDGGDDTDPYRLRKVRGAADVNWLELQLNDNHDESFRIYGNSCEGHGCDAYSSNLYHSFDASGNVYHKGSVAIGTTDAKGYQLAVGGAVIAESVKVKLQGTWPDYVFTPQHKLPSLAEVEKFIQTNKHLPEIPSAKEVETEGISLGEMNAKLLKKIEELTLYMIEKNKLVEELEERVQKLENR